MNLVGQLLLLCIFLLNPDTVFSETDSTREVYGVYKTAGASHYLNGEIIFETSGNSLAMRSVLVDQGREYKTSATLHRLSQNQFKGTGKVFIRYPSGASCNHFFGIIITVKGDEIYVRENTPRHFPYNASNNLCTEGAYEWYNHPEPYVLD